MAITRDATTIDAELFERVIQGIMKSDLNPQFEMVNMFGRTYNADQYRRAKTIDIPINRTVITSTETSSIEYPEDYDAVTLDIESHAWGNFIDTNYTVPEIEEYTLNSDFQGSLLGIASADGLESRRKKFDAGAVEFLEALQYTASPTGDAINAFKLNPSKTDTSDARLVVGSATNYIKPNGDVVKPDNAGTADLIFEFLREQRLKLAEDGIIGPTTRNPNGRIQFRCPLYILENLDQTMENKGGPNEFIRYVEGTNRRVIFDLFELIPVASIKQKRGIVAAGNTKGDRVTSGGLPGVFCYLSTPQFGEHAEGCPALEAQARWNSLRPVCTTWYT